MELKFSSLTETVEEFSTNYVPGSSPRGKTGDPRKCPPARFQDLKPDLILQSSGSGGASFIFGLVSSIMPWIADTTPFTYSVSYIAPGTAMF